MDFDFENTDYMKTMKKRYPLNSIERHIAAIEKMGYSVSTSEYKFQVWDGTSLLIDSDFFEDYYLNAICGIDSFYT